MLIAKLLKRAAIFISSAILTSVALAQPYPSKPVKMILPFPPGGSADTITREVAEKLHADGIGAFIVENKPGAAANLGTSYVVKSPNDGYTLLVGVTGALTINPWLYPDLGYKPDTDLTSITMLAQAPVVLVASMKSGITNVKDLVARAKAKPGQLTYATNGKGTSHHLAGEMFKHRAGIFMLNIPYKGTPGALQDIVSGQVDLGFLDLTAAMPLISSGRIVAVATTGATRPAALPNVPTIAESGYPNYEAMTWISLMAPKGMDPQNVEKINKAVNSILAEENFRKSVAAKGMEAAGSTPGALQSFIKEELVKWKSVIEQANISIN